MPEPIAIICASAYCAIHTLDALTDKQKQQIAGFFIRPSDDFREAAICAKAQGIHVYGYRTEEDRSNGEDGLGKTKSLLTAIRASCIVGVGVSESAMREITPDAATELYIISIPDPSDIDLNKMSRSILVSTWKVNARGKTRIAQTTVRVAKNELPGAAVGHVQNAVREQISCLMSDLEKSFAETAVKPESNKKGKRRGKSVGRILLAIIAVFILSGAGIFVWMNIMGNAASSTYYAPDLRGMTVEEATNYIRETSEYRAHYVISVSDETISSSLYSDGTIAAQTPNAGTSTKQTMTQITVTLCDNTEASEPVLMPDLTGMDYEEAAQILANEYGVTASYTMDSSEQYEQGTVISTSPVAGSELEAGGTVRLYVSSGNATGTSGATMITVVGMSQADAETALTDIGLRVGTITEVESDEDVGIVVGQSIEEGELVDKGSSVSLEVSKGYGTEAATEVETEVEDTTEPEQTDADELSDPGDGTHYININMPSGRTGDSYLVLTINGSELYSAYIGADKTSVRLTVEGTIFSISITLDGESYTDYTIS